MLQEGGNALDACVAMNAMLAVVYPHMCGVGGDLFLLYFEAASGQVFALNASGRAPATATPAEFSRRGLRSIPARGPLSATVPGAVDGWQQAVDRFGSMPLSRLLAPAIETATSGVEVTDRLRGWIQRNQAELRVDPYLRLRFFEDGDANLEPGDRMPLPELALTLQRIADGGAESFYRGEIACEIAAAVHAVDGLLTEEDLAHHTSEWVDSVSVAIGEYDVHATPPNSQGFVALQMLKLMEHWGSAERPFDSSDYIDHVVRAKSLTFVDRDKYLCDPHFYKVPVQRLLSSEYIECLADRAATPLAPSLLAGDTVYICAVDADGNACSLIQSIYYAFGSAFSINQTGIVLHNRGHYFSLNERSPNCIAPGKRPAHTLIAAMALRDGKPAFVFGTMGADGQPQTVAQVATRLFAGEHPQDAVAADRFLSGRFVLEDRDDVLLVEEGLSAMTQAELRTHGHMVETVPRLDERMGHAHAIAVRSDGSLEAGSDPRSDGAALVFERTV